MWVHVRTEEEEQGSSSALQTKAFWKEEKEEIQKQRRAISSVGDVCFCEWYEAKIPAAALNLGVPLRLSLFEPHVCLIWSHIYAQSSCCLFLIRSVWLNRSSCFRWTTSAHCRLHHWQRNKVSPSFSFFFLFLLFCLYPSSLFSPCCIPIFWLLYKCHAPPSSFHLLWLRPRERNGKKRPETRQMRRDRWGTVEMATDMVWA